MFKYFNPGSTTIFSTTTMQCAPTPYPMTGKDLARGLIRRIFWGQNDNFIVIATYCFNSLISAPNRECQLQGRLLLSTIINLQKNKMSPVKTKNLNGVKDLLKALLDLEIISVPHHEDKKRDCCPIPHVKLLTYRGRRKKSNRRKSEPGD